MTGNAAATTELSRLPELLQGPVQRFLERIPDGSLPGGKDISTNLVRLVASSEFAAGVLHRQWDWFCPWLGQEKFRQPFDLQALQLFSADLGASTTDIEATKSELRKFRNRSLVHLLWRSLTELDDVWQTMRALSDLADALVDGCVRFASKLLDERFGAPQDDSGARIPLVVVAMGKLGGRELNFSSDIDLILLYPTNGQTSGPRVLTAHEYFIRLSRQVVKLLDEVTADGFVYRVDTRLRPFGDSGPPVTSYAALEGYLLQHGRSWERYAYVKARVISPPGVTSSGRELQKDLIDPFVYRRYLDYGVFESLREMKSMIEAEVQRRELLDNIKLGPGGIREIEFIAQSLQLVRGGADVHLRCRELRDALARLRSSRVMTRDAVNSLTEAYAFLRRFENGVQSIRDQQTHDVPADPADRQRMQLIMGFDSWDELQQALQGYRDLVSANFESVAFRSAGLQKQEQLGDKLGTKWRTATTAEDWIDVLAELDYKDPQNLANVLIEFRHSSAIQQADATARRRLGLFMRSFLAALKNREQPARVCERVLNVISQIIRRSAYVALLNENPPVLERLIALCEQSAYLSSEIARYPLLLDELLDPRLYTAHISRASMSEDLDERLACLESVDSEDRIEALAQFQRATLFRIAVADISGSLPIMKVSDRLTELAEIVLTEALSVAWNDLVERHGSPGFKTPSGQHERAGFGVIAYGKLGGMELSYRSDLDLVFLHDSRDSDQETNGPKPLENSMFFGRLVRRLVHFLTAQTGSGALYEVDTRLRPSGRSGLLVINLDGFAKYQEDNAWTWEHQALLRSRPIAGSAHVCREFDRLRTETLRFRIRREHLLEDVLQMREKMRTQLDQSSAERFDLKQGEGAIADIEFLVQYLVLKHADKVPALVHYSDNIRQLGTLEASGILEAADVAALQETYKAYRLRSHRLVLDGRAPLVDADSFLAERAFVISVWQREMR